MDDPGTSHVPDAPLPPTEFTQELRDGMFTLLEVASAFQGSGLHLLDLMLIGSPGLIEALDNHDPNRDGDIRTHASPLIERSIRKCLRNVRKSAEPDPGPSRLCLAPIETKRRSPSEPRVVPFRQD